MLDSGSRDRSRRRRHGLLRGWTGSTSGLAPIDGRGRDTVEFAFSSRRGTSAARHGGAAGLRHRRARQPGRLRRPSVPPRVVRLRRLVARGFRNLADLECEPPPSGVVLLGPNAQGKTNLLEAIYYPVLFRSFRGAPDQEVGALRRARAFTSRRDRRRSVARRGARRALTATYGAQARRKRILVEGEEPERLADAVGTWLAVSFLPDDVGLATGPAAGAARLSRPAALARRPPVPAVARALPRGAGAAQQRAAAGAPRAGARVRRRRSPRPGAAVVRARRRWAVGAARAVRRRVRVPGRGRRRAAALPGRRATSPTRRRGTRRSAERLPRDQARGMTTVGPHRDDLVLEVGGRPLREFGSNGQQRGAAVALKLIELAALRARARHRAGAAAGRRVRGVRPASGSAGSPAGCSRPPGARCSSRRRGSTSCRPTWRCPVWRMDAGKVSA